MKDDNNRMVRQGAIIMVIMALIISGLTVAITTNNNVGHIPINVVNAPTATSVKQYGIIGNITVQSEPFGLAYNNLTNVIYTTDYGANNVSVISTSNNTVIKTISVGKGPEGVTYDYQNGEVYVVDASASTVTVIDASNDTKVATVSTGGLPMGIAYNNKTNRIYTANYNAGTLTVISGSNNTVVGTIKGFNSPEDVAYDYKNNEIYVTDSGYEYVTAVNATTDDIIGNITVGELPTQLIYSPESNNIYVASAKVVSIISGSNNTVIKNLTGFNSPTGIAYDNYTNTIFVANSGDSNVSVINGATYAITNISVADNVQGLLYDYKNQELYTADYNSNVVTAINTVPPPPQYLITLKEINLPSGVTWSATVKNSTLAVNTTLTNKTTSSGGSLTFSLVNGSYTTTISTTDNLYHPANAVFTITVAGSAQTINVTFDATVYTTTLKEVNLPKNIEWSATVKNSTLAINTTLTNISTISGGSLAFNLFNGTYSVIITTNNTLYRYLSTLSLTVSGKAQTVNISFTYFYYVTINEIKLPSNNTWSATVKNTTLAVNTTLTNKTTSSGGQVKFVLENGTYTTTISTTNDQYYPSEAVLDITVKGAFQTINVTFIHIVPVAVITVNTTIPYDTAIIISGANSYSIHNTTIVNYTWQITGKENFTAYGKTISEFFSVVGNYSIKLTVRNSVNVTNYTIKTLSVVATTVDNNIIISITKAESSNGSYELTILVDSKDNLPIDQVTTKVGSIYVNTTFEKQEGYNYTYVVWLNPEKFAYGNYTIVITAWDSVQKYNSLTTYLTFGSVNGIGIFTYITTNTILLIVLAFLVVAVLIFAYALTTKPKPRRRQRK